MTNYHKTFRNVFYFVLAIQASLILFGILRPSILYDYLDNNLFIGITGWVCDPKRGKNLESIIPEIPINKLLIETDSPYLLPKSLKVKNRRNEPSFLPIIFDKIANLRKEPRDELKHQIYENSINFFNLSE